jgi:glutathione synthase/RimK-type ligase-like ATP-grasp enzyme
MIAIHNSPGSFSDRWISYCKENKVPFKEVDCYDNNIIEDLKDCSGLMWHWNQEDYKAALFARQLTLSLEKTGLKTFPNVNTCWHFDDKIGQKYLLEAIGAPLVNSYVFYAKKKALDWVNTVSFPKVFKLRGGAGSINVSLIHSRKKARQIIRKAFKNGFSSANSTSRLKDRFWVLKRDKDKTAFKSVLKGFGRFIIKTEYERLTHNQKGYVYFQDFIPGNEFDTRLIVIGNRCFGLRRYCRTGDFRASGSGLLAYEPELFDEKCIKIAFDTAQKLQSQSVAFDFIFDNGQPKIVEISYAFATGKFYDNCLGFWDSKLNWNQTTVNPQYFIIEDFLNSISHHD